MEEGSFDRLARLLGGGATRRTGLRVLMAAMVGLPVAMDAADAGAAKKERRGAETRGGEDEVDAEKRPCGPKPRDNRCTKHGDCCTKYCKKSKKKGAKVGRCRCVRAGRKCKRGMTCCGGSTCKKGKCTRPTPPPGPACGATGATCTADEACCSGLLCKNGACAVCAPDVCASGCAFTSVNDAYAAATAGDTIYIDSGTYPTGISITKDITLAACPGVTGAKLVPDRVLKEPGDTYYVVMTEDRTDTTTLHSVTLRNLEFEGTPDGVTNDDEVLLYSYNTGVIAWTIDNCSLAKGYNGLYALNRQHTVTNSRFSDQKKAGIYVEVDYPAPGSFTLDVTDSTFTECDSYGVYYDVSSAPGTGSYVFNMNVTGCTFTGGGDGGQLYFEGLEDPAAGRSTTTGSVSNCTFTNSVDETIYFYGGVATITNCTVTGGAGTGILFYNAEGTIADSTISGINTQYYAGGVYNDATNYSGTVAITGNTSITNNTSSGNGGGGVGSSAGSSSIVATVTIANPNLVSGNTPDQCHKFIQGTFDNTVSCATWT